MSLDDGQFKKDLYLTSDTSFAAYLMLRGYTLLGKTETGEQMPSGDPIYNLCLLGTGSHKDVAKKYDEFENLFLAIPHEEDRINVKNYYLNTRTCIRVLKGHEVVI